VKEVVSLSPHITVTRSSHARSAHPSTLAAEFAKQGSSPEITDTVTEALSSVLSTARENDLVCVTGSLFVVAEALEYAAREFNS
jgi:dihydrofolate synthase/folylpolyglutamate synthase